MEMITAIQKCKKAVRFSCCLAALILAGSCFVSAQPPIKNYTVKSGRMFITLGKLMSEPALDSFITQYELGELGLKRFIRKGLHDSLEKQGWKVEVNDENIIVISKPLFGIESLKNPGDRILFNEKDIPVDQRFPAVNNNVVYGFNRFRNKAPFYTDDSTVRFYLRGYTNARRVNLAGSFNNWVPNVLSMTLTDSGWIANVKLGPGKYWYKFIADGHWMVDGDNRISENDGYGNTNSVFFKTNVVFALKGYENANRVFLSGSFNNWEPDQLLMNKTSTGWELPLYLANGTHTYRFVADRKWFADPDNPEKYPNEFGEFNSVLRIGKPHLFFLEGYADAKQVILSGSFNKWRREELFMKKTAKGWELPYTLGPGNYEYYFLVDGKKEVKKTNQDGTAVNFNFVLEPNYTFRLKGYQDAKNVYLAGDFNGWSPNSFAMQKQGGDWILPVHLSVGKHLYKFVIDGKWIIDPDNRLWEQNAQNTGNSVIWIGK